MIVIKAEIIFLIIKLYVINKYVLFIYNIYDILINLKIFIFLNKISNNNFK